MSFTGDFSDSSSDEFLGGIHSPYSGWSRIAEKFRALLTNNEPSEIADFLDTFLKFVRNGPKDSRKFTRSISKYLIAMKNLVSNQTALQKSYYVHIKNLLVIYSVLESTNITCFDDASEVASIIITNIFLLMQGLKSVTIMDVLIDIEEIIRSPRSKSVMAIVYRHFLTRTPAAPPLTLDDNNYIKHLILYRSWYTAEVMSEKVNVFERFSSTIKPTEELRTNESYSLLGIDEVVDHKKLLQQPLPRNALIRALRDAESNDDCLNDAENTLSLDELLDLTTDDDTSLKVEVDLSLNLPDETILVDDDDDIDDMVTIDYLRKLFQRMDAIDEYEWRVAVLQQSSETVELFSDSDAKSAAVQRTRKVTFGGATTHVYERCDYDDESCSEKWNSDDSSDVADAVVNSCDSNNTGLYDNFSDRADHMSYRVEYKVDRNRCSSLANRKLRKKKRHHFGARSSKTSIDDWIKRKKLATARARCAASGNVGGKMRYCKVVLNRLTDEEQMSTEKETDRNTSSTTPSKYTVTSALESVMQNQPVLKQANFATLENCPKLELRRCTIRLKPLPANELMLTAQSATKIRKCTNVEVLPSVGGSKNDPSTNSTPNRQFQKVFEKSIPLERSVPSDSVLQLTANDTTLLQKEELLCGPDSHATSQLLLSSEMNCLSLEFDDCDNEIPSPVYSPIRRKRKTDNKSEWKIAVDTGPTVDGSKSDTDNISAIANFIVSTSEPV